MTTTRIARNVSTAAVATIAAWSSWSHMVHLALRFGERPEVAYVLPLSVDGMLVVASTAMVEDKRHGRAVRWSARIAFTAGVAASVAANIAAAHPSVGARIVAAWPAVALLLVVEMLSRARPLSRGQAIEPDTAGDRSGDRRPPQLPEPHMSVDVHTHAPAAEPAPGLVIDHPVAGLMSVRPLPDHGTSRSGGQRSAGRGRQAADVVARLRTERPDASLAEIATEVGVSERHVRRLLASQAAAEAAVISGPPS